MEVKQKITPAEWQRLYRASPQGKAVMRRYTVSAKGKANRKRYKRSAKGRIHVKKTNENYRQTEKGLSYWRKWNLRRYGGGDFTLEMYDALLMQQDGHCALCPRTPEENTHGVLCVDHCHTTERIRGLLCNPCNLALGRFGDAEKGLLSALAYVRGEAVASQPWVSWQDFSDTRKEVA